MFSVNRAAASALNIINTSAESSSVENRQKTSGFDEIFGRTLADAAANNTTPAAPIEEARIEKKAQPRDEFQSIESKEPLRQPQEINEKQARNVRDDRAESRSDKVYVIKDFTEKNESVKKQSGNEAPIRIDTRKTKLSVQEKNPGKEKEKPGQDIEKMLRDIDSLIEKLSSQSRTSSILKDVAAIKDEIRDALSSEKKNPRLQILLDALKDKLTAIESRMNTAPDEKALIATLKTTLQDLNKKIQHEKENRQAPAPAEISPEKNAVLHKNAETKGNASGEQNRGDARQGQQWNVTALKSNFECAPERAAADRPAEAPRFSAQLDAIIDRARVVVRDSRNASFSLRLNPKELGALHVNLGLEQGVLHGKFLVETPEARTMLMQNIELIRQELAQSGLSLGEFQVNVRDQRDEFQREISKKQKRADIQLREIGAEYATNTVMGHDGSINLVI